MGADTFWDRASGDSAQAAFENAVSTARFNYGHAGYTGTIAEKNSFVMIELPDGQDPEAYANKLLGENDPRIDDKWGPAGCLSLGENQYLFFGWASS